MKILTIGFLILVIMSGQLHADDHSVINNKITLNLDGASEVLVKGFIAPIGNPRSEHFKEWDELVNLRVAEPEKLYPSSVFQAFLPDEPASVSELWRIEEEGVLTLLRQLHPNPNLVLCHRLFDGYSFLSLMRASSAVNRQLTVALC